MVKFYVAALMLGVSLHALLAAADSDEFDSDERFGRPSFRSHNNRRFSSSSSLPSWSRRDDSDESDERWGGAARWARPAATRNWRASTGRPLNTASKWNSGQWNNGQRNNGQWNSNSLGRNTNQIKWSSRQPTKWQNSGSKWSNSLTSNNHRNAGKTSSNSGKWRNTKSWNRRWW